MQHTQRAKQLQNRWAGPLLAAVVVLETSVEIEAGIARPLVASANAMKLLFKQ